MGTRNPRNATELAAETWQRVLSLESAMSQIPRREPVGVVKVWLHGPTPRGYLELDGDTPDIADYPDLAALWGTTFGGDGTTTFGLPDLSGQTIAGVAVEYIVKT
jgi:hypothetical protein